MNENMGFLFAVVSDPGEFVGFRALSEELSIVPVRTHERLDETMAEYVYIAVAVGADKMENRKGRPCDYTCNKNQAYHK